MVEVLSDPATTLVEEFIPTRASLLERLKNLSAEDSWKDFFDLYWRLIYRTARRYGLNEQDSEEVVQETMIGLARKLPEYRYEPSKCSFKTYLMRLVRWRISNYLQRKRIDLSRLERPEIEDAWERAWEEDWRMNLYANAIERVRARFAPKFFQAFDLCVQQERGAIETSKLLNLSLAAVYVYSRRISKAIAHEVEKLQREEP